MKKILLLALSIAYTISGIAQVGERNQAMSLGTHNALYVEFSEVSEKLVNSVWEDFVKENYNAKSKWNRKADEWLTENADIPALGLGKTVGLYAQAKEKSGEVTFYLWVDLGDTYLTRMDNPERFAEAEKILHRFMAEVEKETIRQDLAAQQKKLEDLESDLKKLKSANERYNKDIEKAKEAISKAEASIVKNQEDQEKTLQQIEDQKKAVEAVNQRLKGN